TCRTQGSLTPSNIDGQTRGAQCSPSLYPNEVFEMTKLNSHTMYSVYASNGAIDPNTSRTYFWLNANYANEVEAIAAAVRIVENEERGAKIAEIRTITTITKG